MVIAIGKLFRDTKLVTKRRLQQSKTAKLCGQLEGCDRLQSIDQLLGHLRQIELVLQVPVTAVVIYGARLLHVLAKTGDNRVLVAVGDLVP